MIHRPHLHIVLFALVLIPFTSFGQKKKKGRSAKPLYYYEYGMPIFKEGINQECVEDLQLQYGFGIIRKAGCLVTKAQARRWNAHNRRVDAALRKRHGEDWETRFEFEVKRCLN